MVDLIFFIEVIRALVVLNAISDHVTSRPVDVMNETIVYDTIVYQPGSVSLVKKLNAGGAGRRPTHIANFKTLNGDPSLIPHINTGFRGVNAGTTSVDTPRSRMVMASSSCHPRERQ